MSTQPSHKATARQATSRGMTRHRVAVTLDFLRVLRIKTLREFMKRFFLNLLYGVLSIGLVLLVTGCGEDPRFSGNTQYVGGVYGGQEDRKSVV